MQLFQVTLLMAGLTSMASAAYVPPAFFPIVRFTPPVYAPAKTTTTTTKATTSSSKSSTTAVHYTTTSSSSTTKSTTTSTSSSTTTTTTSSTTTSSSTTSSTTASTAFCLSPAAATGLVNGYASLLTAYDNDTANALLASDFTDTSDSINYLAGIPLGDTTFASVAAFEASQSTQPAIGFTVLSLDAITCSVIAFRWVASLGTYPVKGINVLYASNLNNSDAGWQIESMYAEFNVGAWELDIGNTCGNGATVAK